MPKPSERDVLFNKWCPVKITDATKAPKASAVVSCWRNGWNAGWAAADEKYKPLVDAVVAFLGLPWSKEYEALYELPREGRALENMWAEARKLKGEPDAKTK